MTHDRPDRYLPSPVPADERLPDGVGPFTAFGQFGPGFLDLRVFEQDRYWVDRDGRPHLLEDMTGGYRQAVIAMLERRCEEFHLAVSETLTARVIDDLVEGHVNGDVILVALGEPLTSEIPPDVWLEATPLLRRLRTLERRR